MTMSKSLGAGQAKDYYQAEYTNTQESYYTEDENVKGEWFGKQADAWNLEGEVKQEPFERLCEGQDPRTGVQLVRHVAVEKRTKTHTAKWLRPANIVRVGMRPSQRPRVSPSPHWLAVMSGSWQAHDRSVNAALGSWRSTPKLASEATIRQRRRAR